ncbi:amidase [Fictibacillus macauensis ZFHKF-1]|uniref:Amidase n=1 Tax=Fictibacillus macauensis ZFHKF-1 TaxID=1196324 RepID=I8AKH7_9BACL|nr:amidase family protein [Fictibacillus macauensis]EIT86064.1 amidase [Fictibacillus macauensis ZFHKF-1]
MKRLLKFAGIGAAAAAAVAALAVKKTKSQNDQAVLQSHKTPSFSQRTLDFKPFKKAMHEMSRKRHSEIDAMVANASILSIQKRLKRKELTCQELVTYYVINIEKNDEDTLNAVVELNPDALTIAKKLDDTNHVTNGKLFGIPLLLKDNIGTADRMHTSAGADVLKEAFTDEDAFLVEQIRKQQGILLGKTNMSEWAYYMSEKAPNGYSSLGGQTMNPYGGFDVGGSSSGSGVAVAANLAPLAVGTETCGSIISPATQNSVVGLKPTFGTISRHRIIPIASALDTAGPMAKSVEDVAVLFEVMNVVDERDPASISCSFSATAVQSLDQKQASRMTIAYLAHPDTTQEEEQIVTRVMKELQYSGFYVTKVQLESPKHIDLNSIMRESFENDVNAYLKKTKTHSSLTVQQIVDYNKKRITFRAPFGQECLVESVENKHMNSQELAHHIAQTREQARSFLDAAMANGADALLTLGTSHAVEYCGAGYPALSIPAGYKANGEPVGITLIGKPRSEEKLLSIGRTYEEETKHRRSPSL